MDNRKKLVVGVSVTGADAYWALALVMLLSLKRHLDVAPTRIMVATDQQQKFDTFKELQRVFDCIFERVEPRGFYADLVPSMKGNYATYWKFDLFHALHDDEALMYLDVDAFALEKLNVADIVGVLSEEGGERLAAVPAQRPVLERVAATRIRSPFEYCNAGVLFGLKDPRYKESSITAAYAEIIKFDTLNIFWHDQDIFNYLFRHDIFKLPYVYNVHTGYVARDYRAPYLVNGLASGDIDAHAKIVHISGDYLLSNRYHPYKQKFSLQVDAAMAILDSVGLLEKNEWADFQAALMKLKNKATCTSTDYWLQCIGLRRRTFAAHFYGSRLKSVLRKIKRLVTSRRI